MTTSHDQSPQHISKDLLEKLKKAKFSQYENVIDEVSYPCFFVDYPNGDRIKIAACKLKNVPSDHARFQLPDSPIVPIQASSETVVFVTTKRDTEKKITGTFVFSNMTGAVSFGFDISDYNRAQQDKVNDAA